MDSTTPRQIGRLLHHRRAVILVEGISDQIAMESLAHRLGGDLEGGGVVVVPVGGAHAATRFLIEFGRRRAGLVIAGLCDRGEEEVIRRALWTAGLGDPESRADMERLGFYVCVEDLEDEMIRSLGTDAVEALFDSQGDLGSFRRLQMQPAWRGRDVTAQMRRFLGAGSRRKLRYARVFADSVGLDRVPRPLRATLERVLI